MTPNPEPGPASPGGVTSTLWTVFLGLALVRLVTARRAPDIAEPSDPTRHLGPGAKSYSGRPAQRVADTEPDRGRHAETPTEIPAKGWKDILYRVYVEFQKDRVLSVAAGVTFYTLLAIFPAIAALVSLYGLFTDPATINDHLSLLQGVLPSGALDIIGDQVKRITAKGGTTLGLTFFTSLAISLWSANAGVKAIFDALNIVYEEEEKRSFIRLNLQSLAFTLGGLLFVVFALTGIVVLPVILNFVGTFGISISPKAWYIALLRWPILLAVLLLALAVLYRYGPSRDKPQWRWVTPGSLIAGVVWIIGSIAFSWYVAHFGSYNETYGSLGAAVGFMTWIWISATIVLLGGEINAELEHQTIRDTTEGAPAPLGTRRARMADTVGAPA
ncbi:ribonuclease BN [Methylobacterium sp. 4-46]|uniref:YihY/virulence factor BrkB family protein n=1 Tax=unclassified Methylobacterium TaxID=2615210 RepID=UPI000152D9B5|nr:MULTISPECIES: YihY/virulence factor BrkB family protein [Methylobacterium]ACA15942.1 ribonuclease BN [Methylobacterium sp. 4-46]WFT81659.1 YihY/virulence factor BrkB family protein [Methylobacterium nodulans]